MVVTVLVQVMVEGDVETIGQKVGKLRAAAVEAGGGKTIRWEERGGPPRRRAQAATTERAQDAGDGSPEGDEAAMEAAAGVNDEAAGPLYG